MLSLTMSYNEVTQLIAIIAAVLTFLSGTIIPILIKLKNSKTITNFIAILKSVNSFNKIEFEKDKFNLLMDSDYEDDDEILKQWLYKFKLDNPSKIAFCDMFEKAWDYVHYDRVRYGKHRDLFFAFISSHTKLI